MLAALALFAACNAIAVETVQSDYVIEGTLLMLPSIVLPQTGNEAYEYHPYQPFTFAAPAHVTTEGGVTFGLAGSAYARVYADPPIEGLLEGEEAVEKMHPTYDEAADAVLLRLKGTDRIIEVPRAAWASGEERAVTQPAPAVYFEDAGAGKVVRHTLPDMPPLGIRVRLTLKDAADVSDEVLEAKLDTPIGRFQFHRRDIIEVFRFLSDSAGVPIAIDPAAVTDGRIEGMAMATAPLRNALEHMCARRPITYVKRPGYIWITSERNRESARRPPASTVIMEIATTKMAVTERARLDEAPFLAVGKPTIDEWNGKLELALPVDQWALVTLDGDSILEYVLLVRVRHLEDVL